MDNNTRRQTGNGIVAEQKCKRIERSDPDSLRSDPNMEIARKRVGMKIKTEIDGKRGKDG